MGRRIWTFSWVAIALLQASLLGGCTGGSGESGFLGLLEAVPDTRDTRNLVVVHDYGLYRDAFELKLPGPEADEAALGDYHIVPLDGTRPPVFGPWISGYGQFAMQALDRRRYLGFDFRNVEQSLEAGPPYKLLEVISGNFNPKNIEQALKDCSECISPDREQHDGTNFYSWGEDYAIDAGKIFVPPAFDQVGRGGRIAVLEHHVFRTLDTGGMESLIDAYLGKNDSLADNDEFRSLAEEISKLGVYAAVFSDQTMDVRDVESLLGDSFTQEDLDKIRYEVEKGGLLRPYLAYASGTGKDEGGEFWALALLHRRANLAEDNVDLFRVRMEDASSLWYTTLWLEMIDSMEVRNDDRILVAKLYGEIA